MNFSNLNADAQGPAPSPDEALMLQAVTLARQAKGRTAPNPCVGALLVKEGRVLASGYHHKAGLPHAEVEALADARSRGIDPAQTTLYVTLEPCNHYGRTPPCTEAILEAGIQKVVIGVLDSNPKVTGGGAETLRRAGVTVVTGVAEEPCRELIADFLVWTTSDRPYVILKLAATLDGRIATRTGQSRWVTGKEARHAVHVLRSQVDAVLIGGNTLRQDNPQLTCRLEGRNQSEAQPKAIVVTSLPPQEMATAGQYYLFNERREDTILFTSDAAKPLIEADLPDSLKIKTYGLPGIPDGVGLNLRHGLKAVRRDFGVHTVLCEGGGRLAASLLAQNLVDEFHLFLAPKFLADAQARPLLDGLAPESMDHALNMRFSDIRSAGRDLILVLRRQED